MNFQLIRRRLNDLHDVKRSIEKWMALATQEVELPLVEPYGDMQIVNLKARSET